MSGAGRTVVQPSVLSDRPTGDPFPSRNVDPGARQFLSQYAYLHGAGPGIVPSIGLPNAGSLGPNWAATDTSQTPPASPTTPTDGCT